MITVRQLLQPKGQEVWSVSPASPVYEALELLADGAIKNRPMRALLDSQD